jgi:hypothetical protein
MMKAFIGAIATGVIAKLSMSLALAVLVLTGACLDRYDRFALSRSVITLLRFILMVRSIATAKASSFVKPANTLGWWHNGKLDYRKLYYRWTRNVENGWVLLANHRCWCYHHVC